MYPQLIFIKNKDIITNVRKAEHPIWLKGIGGKLMLVDLEGDLLGYGKVYYHPHVTANVLSFFFNNMTK
jgi:hypothetical protein